jgi:hypothetical protein
VSDPTETLTALTRLKALSDAPRRNPQAGRPHRTGGPPAPPDPDEMRRLQRQAERETAREAKRLFDEDRAEFKRRRGCPPHVADIYIEVLRKQGAWWEDDVHPLLRKGWIPSPKPAP